MRKRTFKANKLDRAASAENQFQARVRFLSDLAFLYCARREGRVEMRNGKMQIVTAVQWKGSLLEGAFN